jgi:hypothetical protein
MHGVADDIFDAQVPIGTNDRAVLQCISHAAVFFAHENLPSKIEKIHMCELIFR